jgi:hypothetical protein
VGLLENSFAVFPSSAICARTGAAARKNAKVNAVTVLREDPTRRPAFDAKETPGPALPFGAGSPETHRKIRIDTRVPNPAPLSPLSIL